MLTDFGGRWRRHNQHRRLQSHRGVAPASAAIRRRPRLLLSPDQRPSNFCSRPRLHLGKGAVIKAPEPSPRSAAPPARSSPRPYASAVYKVPDPRITGNKLHDVAPPAPAPSTARQHCWAWFRAAAPMPIPRASLTASALPAGRIFVIAPVERLHVADITLTNSVDFHLFPKNIPT